MYFSLTDFIEGIDNLIKHITSEEQKENYFKNGVSIYKGSSSFEIDFRDIVDTTIKDSITNSKRFMYNSTIISLYGFLEVYLENLVAEYVSNLNMKCSRFSNLPNEIVKHHLDASIDLLKFNKRNRNVNTSQYEIISKEIVSNLNSCLCGVFPYTLNERAFALHTSNFRYDSIIELFNKVGIKNISREALDKEVLISELCNIHSIDGDFEKSILISLLSSALNDLAERRNEVSHGNANSDIQSFQIFKEKVNLIKCFGQAVHEVVVDYYTEFMFHVAEKIELGNPVKIFTGLNVFGFKILPNVSQNLGEVISVSDDIFAYKENSSKKLITGKIIGLVENTVEKERIIVSENSEIAIKVDFNVTSHMLNRDISIHKKNKTVRIVLSPDSDQSSTSEE